MKRPQQSSSSRSADRARKLPFSALALISALSGCSVYRTELLANGHASRALDVSDAGGDAGSDAGSGDAQSSGGSARSEGTQTAGSSAQAGGAGSSIGSAPVGGSGGSGGSVASSGGATGAAGSSGAAGLGGNSGAAGASGVGGSSGAGGAPQGGTGGQVGSGASGPGGMGGGPATQSVLSNGMKVTASTQQTGNEAAKGNDGNSSTRWCATDDSMPQWWRVDLGATHELSSFNVLFQFGDRQYSYVIETSDDDALYTSRVTLNGVGAIQSADFPDATTGRYVRITVTSAAPVVYQGVTIRTWASFFEFSVIGQ